MVARSEPFRSLFDEASGADVVAVPRAPSAEDHADAPPAADDGPNAFSQRLDQLVLAGGVTPPRGLMPRLTDLRPIAPFNRSEAHDEGTATGVNVQSLEGRRPRPALWRPKPAAVEEPTTPALPASLAAPARPSADALAPGEGAPTVFSAILAAHSSDQEPTRRVDLRSLVAVTRDAPRAESQPEPALVDSGALHGTDAELTADTQRAVTLPGRAPRGAARRAPPPELTAAPDVAATPDRAAHPRFASIALASADEIVTAVDAKPTLFAPFQSSENAEAQGAARAAPAAVHGESAVKATGRYRLRPELSTTSSRPLPVLATVLPLPFDDDDDAGTVVDVHPAHDTDVQVAGGSWGEDKPARPVDARARGIFATTLESVSEVLTGASSASGEDAEIDVDTAGFTEDEITVVNASVPRRVLAPSPSPAGPAGLLASAASDDGDSVFTNIRPRAASTVAAVTAIAPSPVIVRIPSRQQATPRAQAKAREHYLAAVDYLARGDKKAAMGNLRLALHYDDNAVLYRDLLAQLQKGSGEGQPVGAGRRRP